MGDTTGFTRRTVLGGAMAGAVAVPGAARATPTQIGRVTTPTPRQWADLDRRIDGDVLTPGEAGFDEAHRLFDPWWDSVVPAAVVRPRGSPDVATAVEFAQRHRLETVARSGGHSYVGASAAAGAMVLDLRSMTWTNLTGTTASVLAGALSYPLHETLARSGRSIPTGTCPTVGASGLTLGGGIGVESREYGLTSDAVVGATVVTKGGVLREVDAAHEPDLFWAIRGGGTGTGIVTKWRYRTHPTRRLGFFTLTFASSDAVRVLTGWSAWLAGATRSSWASVHVDALGSRGLQVRVVGVCRAGDEQGEASAFERAVGRSASSQNLSQRDYLDGVRWLGGGTTSPRQSFVAGTDVLRVMTSGGARAIVETVAARANAGGTASALVDPLDARVEDTQWDATPFRWRGHVASVQWYVGLPSPTSGARDAAYRWIRSGHAALGSRSSGGYLNYLEPGDYLSRYLGSPNARRQLDLRLRYRV